MPIKTPGGILEVEDAKLRASYLLANTSVGIGTSTTVPDGASLYIKEDNPTIRFQEGTTTSAARILAKSGTLRLESGTDYDQPELTGDIAFSNVQGGTTHMIIKGGGNVGIGTDAPLARLDVHGTANVGALTATLTYSNAASNIVTWNSSTNEIIDSGLEKGFTEHPVESLTGSTTYNANIGSAGEFTPSTHYVEGHGTYEAWSSTQYNVSGQDTREVWKLFDTSSDYWGTSLSSGYESYNSSSPYEYVGTRDTTTTDVGGTRYKGVFVQLKMPYAITLAYTDVYRNNLSNNANRAPGAGVFLGSNDGEAWYKLTEFSGASYTTDDKERITVNATTPYQYYRFVITNIVGGNSQNSTLFSQWRLFAEKDVTKMENLHISGDLSSETLQTGYIKWPRKSLKANESEGYIVKASSYENSQDRRQAYNAFNDFVRFEGDLYAPNWISVISFNSSGIPINGTAASFDGNDCEWIQIKLPVAISLSYYQLRQRINEADGPVSGYMYASNDEVSWDKIHAFSDITYDSNGVHKENVKSNKSYEYYRLVVTKVASGLNSPRALIEEFQLFEAATGVGAPPTSAKLQVHGSLGLAKGSSLYAGDSVVAEFPKHDRPLTKYPEVSMAVNNSGLNSGYTSDGYTIRASSEYAIGYGATNAFGPGDAWITGSADYSNSDGSPVTITANTDKFGENGSWLEIKLPVPIKLQYHKIYNRATHLERITKFNLWASNTGADLDWTKLQNNEFTSNVYTDEIPSTSMVNSNYFYKYYAIQVKQIGWTGTYANIGEWELYGTEEGDESVDVVHRSVPNKPGQQQLEVYWDANDSNSYSFADSDAVYDLSGNGVTGTITGTNGFDTEYNAWVFDGSGDYISTTSSGLGTGGAFDHSFAFWFKINRNITNNDYVVTFGEEANDNMIAVNISGNSLIHLDNWGRGVITGDIVRLGTWYHVACTHTGSATGDINTQLIYVNGIRQTTRVTGTGTLAFTSDRITVGARPGTNNSNTPTAFLDGAVSSVRFFKGKVLNADQVRELYEYDAERFGHRTNVVSLHKGNLGVGVTHPTARLEVAGREDLQEYPPRAITQPGTSYVGYRLEEYIEEHGLFVVDGSAIYNAGGADRRTWSLFDKGSQLYHGGYYFTSGTPAAIDETTTLANNDENIDFYTRLSSGGTIFADWAQLELPHKILLKRNVIKNHNLLTRSAAKGYIVASNDGLTFDVLNTIGDFGYTTTYQEKTFITNTNTYYRIYRLLFTHKIGGDSNLSMNMGEWRLFGTPAPSSLEDGHLTLGKALTAPRFSGHAAGAETPRAESLVVHYDTTVDSVVSGTTVVDTSGEGNNGTLNGDAAYSSSDRALTFDGTGDYVSGTLNNPSGAWVHSISLWFKGTGLTSTNNHTLFQIGEQTTGNAILSRVETDMIRYNFFDGDFQAAVTINNNEWYHAVYTYTGGSTASARTIYLNGVKLNATVVAGTIGALNIAANEDFTIGSQRAILEGYFPGSISNFKLWDVALTADEVAAEYALGRTGKSLNITDTAVCLGGTVPRAQLDVRGSVIVNDVVRQLNKPFFTCAPYTNGFKAVPTTYQVYWYSNNSSLSAVSTPNAFRWTLNSIPLTNYLYGSRNVQLVRVLDDTTSQTSGVRVPYEGVYILTQTARTTGNAGVTFWVYSASEAKYIQLSDANYKVPWGGGSSGTSALSDGVSTMAYLKAGDIVIFVHNNGNYITGSYEQHVSLAML